MNNQERIQEIENKLTEKFAPLAMEIIDESQYHAGHPGAASGAGHFAISITSEAFAGKSLVERHRLIYGALSDMMESEIHALKIKADAPK